MATKKKPTSKKPAAPKAAPATEAPGDYLWRGGKKIAVEKQGDRFTVMPANPAQLERVLSAPGVRTLKPVTNQVFKVETTMDQRDGAMAALRSDAYNAVVHHAYRPAGGEGSVFYLTDRIVVHFAPRATTAQIDRLLEKYALRMVKEYPGDERAVMVQVTGSSGGNPLKVSNLLAQEPAVQSAEPNLVNRFQPAFIPPDGYFRRQWHLDARDAPQLVAGADVDAPAAWDVTRGERSIVVAVIDDGFDLSHPDFTGEGKIVAPKDYVDGDSNPFPVTEAEDYHGTPCAGVAIAESNGRGVVGAAHGCAFMPIRFPLSADDDLLSEIFETAAEHADVISCSWGPPPVDAPLSTLLTNTFTRLTRTGGRRGRGVVICFAAGNYNAPIRDDRNPNGHVWRDYTGVLRRTRGPILNGNAAHPGIIAVAASTSLNRHSAYSNWGAEISVCAPSNNFHPLDPQQFVPGRGIWTTDNEAFGGGFTSNSRYTGNFGGTSSATPLVAGVAALVLSANPNLSAPEVKQILQSTADKIVDTQPDIVLGTNRGQYDGRGRCDWFGFGKINAARAVAEARRRAGR
jgi:subtilisin family serine protease